MARLAVARLWFCSNSFTPRRTRAEDVWANEWSAGSSVLAAAQPGGELDGVRQFLAQRAGWSVTALRCASAPAGGPLSAELFGTWMAEIENDLRRGRFDAVYLSLHGACQAEGDPAADVTILRRVRSIVGHTPVVASFDMRANLSEETAILLDGSSVNPVWPHGGGDVAAMRALGLLEGILSGRCRPVGALARVPVVLSDAVLPEALAEMRQGLLGKLPPGVLEASVFGGFAWGDSPYAGPSALAWADRDAGVARETAAHLALLLTRWRSRPGPSMVPPETALRRVGGAERAGPPVLLLDVADDPAAGSLADTPELLRAVLAESAAGRLGGTILVAALHDAETVSLAMAVGPGGVLQRQLGGRSTALYGQGVAVRAVVVAAGEAGAGGRFALLRVGAVDILVTAERLGMLSPARLATMGIVTADYRVLAIKGGIDARDAFAGDVGEVVLCDCPGPSSPDLTRLPYHYVPAARRAPASASSAAVAVAALPVVTSEKIAKAPVALAPGGFAGRAEERRGTMVPKRAEPFGAQRR